MTSRLGFGHPHRTGRQCGLALAGVLLALAGQPMVWWRPGEQLLGLRPPDALGAVLVAGVAVPLAFAGRQPLLGLATSATAMLTYGALGYPPSPADLATLVLLGWVVAVCRPAAAAAAGAGILAGSAAAGAIRPGGHSMPELAAAVLAPVIAMAAGLAVRAHRDPAGSSSWRWSAASWPPSGPPPPNGCAWPASCTTLSGTR